MTNSIAEAPVNMFDMQPGGTSDTGGAFSCLQDEFLSSATATNFASAKDNSFTGSILAEADDTVAEGLNEGDDAIAQAIGGDKSMPVIAAHQGLDETAGLVSTVGSKQFLNIPNPANDIYNTPSAQASFDWLFDAKKDPVA